MEHVTAKLLWLKPRVTLKNITIQEKSRKKLEHMVHQNQLKRKMIKKWFLKFIRIQNKSLLKNLIWISKIVLYACSLSVKMIKKMQVRELRRIRSSIKMKNRQMKQSLLSDKMILQLKNYYL